MNEKFDVVIVGGGSTGSVAGARLSEDSGCRVLILEAGIRFRRSGQGAGLLLR